MRLIYAEDIKKRADCYPPLVRVCVANIVSHTKTVKDAAKVVRCKDCKYGIDWDGRLGCEWHGFYQTEPTWFCADGERREDATVHN